MVKFSVRKPLTVFVAVLAVIILGVVAYLKMTPDLLPNMDFPYVIVVTTYPGASPESVEETVTKPIEQSMATLEHIKSLSSTSSENYSMVILEFEDSVNLDTVGVDIQQNIVSLSGQWDDAIGTPYVIKINPSMLPVAVTAVGMEDTDIIELTDFVNNTLMQKLEGVPGVASISVTGAVDRQVHVIISEDKINKVNQKMQDAVSSKIQDAREELEDTKAELEDAKEELESAQKKLNKGKKTLSNKTSGAESTLNEQSQELLLAKIQLQEQLAELQAKKSTVEASLSALKPVAENIGKVTQAVQEKTQQLEALQAAESDLAKADAKMDAVNAKLEAIEIDSSLSDDEKALQTAAVYGSDEYSSAVSAVSEAEVALSELGTSRYTLATAITTAQAELAGANAMAGALESQLAAQGTTVEELTSNVAQMEAGLAEIEAAEAMLTESLAQIESGSGQLSDAQKALSKAQSSGILSIAEASAQITINSASIDAALTQVDSGLETLNDSESEALSKADLSGKLNLSTVAALLGAQNFSMPAGYVEQDGISYMVSVGDLIENEAELRGLLLFDTGEDGIGRIYLSDVAEILITDTSDESYARLDGETGLILSFEKQSNAATADVTEALSEKFDVLEAEYPGLSFVNLMDQGDYIHLIISSILESLLFGAIFAILVLFLFLRDIRPTIITLVSIPVSLIAAIVCMYFSGVTLNMISLSGLAVAVGMLVDNSIVVIENIFRLRNKGATALQAAVVGTRQVAGAIAASTLTTICVFLPIVFVEGITRQLFTDLALTMCYSLLASLLIALTLVPAMAKGMLKKPLRTVEGKKESVFYRAYRKVIAWSLKYKAVVLILALVLLAGSAFLALNRGFSYMPDIDMNTVSLTVTMPEDIDRDGAVEIADELLERVASVDEVQNVGAMMGSTGLLGSLGGGGNSYDLTVYVLLPEGVSGAEKGAEIQALCEDLPCTVYYDSAMLDMSYLSGSGITVHVFGSDIAELQRAADSVGDVLSGVEGVAAVDTGLENAAPALHVIVNKNAAMAKGLTVAQVYMQVASSLTDSTTIMTMDIGGIDADVSVESASVSADELAALEFETTDTEGKTSSFRLDEIASIEDTVSRTSINRSEQRRYVNVTAELEPGYNVTKVTSAAAEALRDLELPKDVSTEFDGENEVIIDAIEQLMLMLALGVVLVYFIMVAQFQSLKSPFIVMFAIPLAFTGGFLALLICGMDVSIISLIGFIMLTGVIVNNGIVLVDYINQLREGGMSRRDALIEAGVTRMRPIFMTTLTTILGLIVMALGKDAGTALMQPIAVVCIGGLTYATLMTLLVIPCIYDIFCKKDPEVITEESMTFDEL